MPLSAPSRCAQCGQLKRGQCSCAKGWSNRPSRERTVPTSHRKWRTLRASILANEPACRSCGRDADEVDHITPIAEGGAEMDPNNLQPLCKPCHKAKTRAESLRARGGTARYTLVCGPPCGGKNSYVAERARPGDLIVDLDAILSALSGLPTHQHDERIKPLAFDARDAVLQRLASGRHDITRAWIIATAPTERDRRAYKQMGCRLVMVTASRDVLMERAQAERPAGWVGFVDEWLESHDERGVDEVIHTA